MRLNDFLDQWGVAGLFAAVVLVLLYFALKERRISIGHGAFKAYYIERDTNPIGYWFVVTVYVAILLAAPMLLYSNGPPPKS